jgi:hypothetical protein
MEPFSVADCPRIVHCVRGATLDELSSTPNYLKRNVGIALNCPAELFEHIDQVLKHLGLGNEGRSACLPGEVYIPFFPGSCED